MKALRLNVTLLKNEIGEQELSITLINDSDAVIKPMSLHIDVARWTDSLELSQPNRGIEDKTESPVFSQIGSHLVIPFTQSVTSNSSLCWRLLTRQAAYLRLSDFPSSSYLNFEHKQVQLVMELNVEILQDSPKIEACKLKPAGRDIIVPEPAKLDYIEQTIVITWPLRILCESNETLLDQQLAWVSRQNAGLTFCNSDAGKVGNGDILLSFEYDQSLETEGYTLELQGQNWHIAWSSESGRFYALVSLSQLLMNQPDVIEAQLIQDCPRYDYRGQMLDCARHFQPLNRIKMLLDWMAFYKLNRFHWHLTDDEAWRLEIKAYPQLCEIGAWRGEGLALCSQFGSGAGKSGGYYTQAEVSDILSYAAMLQIEVIPEIDIPGHARAAILALPELLVEAQDQSTYQSVQFYNDNVLNPGLTSTLEFLETVLDEVCVLFPSSVIHLGGDEVPKGVWQHSPAVSELAIGKQKTAESYLFQHLQQHLNQRQRLLAGWEEIAHHQLDTSAIVYAWNGIEVGLECANKGYRVVQCPAQHAYLDMAWDNSPLEPGFHWAGTINLKQAYEWQARDSSLSQAQQALIIGTQSQLWSELITTKERFEYMVFPRVCANAEVAWSLDTKQNYLHFSTKLNHHQQYWKSRDIQAKYLELEKG
ncbi:beta-hexosaminidase [Alginatibacterium sediminis]|uniref:beta-N-acetylhexosaminidase n=1 Tax=Alginatibacterium sediminis TaxID=2164068 RepID=A0A420E6U3_9ALTE|nr:beta-N-acetylhexosaminidase [Alginatibacterium sediminis]RKF14262.1 beta-hexosaminidase [Alginatibacterium sediminis]